MKVEMSVPAAIRAASIREECQRLLDLSDREVVADRWEVMNAKTRRAWSEYRTQLRLIYKSCGDNGYTLKQYPVRPDGKIV